MDRSPLLAAADALDRLTARTTGGDWRRTGLLAVRPEVVTRHGDGSGEHVADARAGTADWIVALSPVLAAPLAAWLRSASDAPTPEASAFARALLDRL